MSSEINVNGRSYISSKQAAKETGYTHDYIGQLTRGGKVPGKLVGRTKFIDIEALKEYKRLSENGKKENAEARREKFKAGRMVPISVGATSAIEYASSGDAGAAQTDADTGGASTAGLPDTDTHGDVAPAEEVPVISYREAKDDGEKESATPPAKERAQHLIPSPLSRPQLAATAMLFLMLAGSAYAFTSIPDVKERAERVARNAHAQINNAVGDVGDSLALSVGALSERVFNNDEEERGEKNGIKEVVIKRISYLRYELAYVGANAKYRFLTIGEDVVRASQNAARFVYATPARAIPALRESHGTYLEAPLTVLRDGYTQGLYGYVSGAYVARDVITNGGRMAVQSVNEAFVMLEETATGVVQNTARQVNEYASWVSGLPAALQNVAGEAGALALGSVDLPDVAVLLEDAARATHSTMSAAASTAQAGAERAVRAPAAVWGYVSHHTAPLHHIKNGYVAAISAWVDTLRGATLAVAKVEWGLFAGAYSAGAHVYEGGAIMAGVLSQGVDSFAAAAFEGLNMLSRGVGSSIAAVSEGFNIFERGAMSIYRQGEWMRNTLSSFFWREDVDEQIINGEEGGDADQSQTKEQPQVAEEEPTPETPQTVQPDGTGGTRVVERIVERVVEASRPLSVQPVGITEEELTTRLQELENELRQEIFRVQGENSSNTVRTITRTISQTNRIDQLSNVTITNATFEGSKSGLDFLSASGGTLTGALTAPTIAVTGTTTFNGVGYLFPSADGSDGQALTTDGAGGLAWETISGGGGGTASTLEDIATNSSTTASALYTMTDGIDVEFEDSDNNSLFYLDEDGNVGIGTTGVGEKLTIEDGNLFLGASSINDFSPYVRLTERSTSNFQGGFIQYEATDNVLNIGVHDNNDAATSSDINAISVVRSTGDVGIGTADPAGLLNLRGFTGGVGTSDVASHTKTLVIGSDSFNVSHNSGNANLLYIGDYSNDAGDDVYPIYVENENNDVDFFINSGTSGGVGTAYFGGNVGVGTTSPWAKLSVTGSAGQTSPLFQVASSTNTEVLTISPRGYFTLNPDPPNNGTTFFDIGTITVNNNEAAIDAVKTTKVDAGVNTNSLQLGGGDARGAVLTLYGQSQSPGNYFTLQSQNLSNETSIGTSIIEGGTAQSGASTNITGGDLRVTGGSGASASAGDAHGGDVFIAGGFGYGTGDHGNVILTATSSTGGFIGNVGIGVVAPTEALEVSGGAVFNAGDAREEITLTSDGNDGVIDFGTIHGFLKWNGGGDVLKLNADNNSVEFQRDGNRHVEISGDSNFIRTTNYSDPFLIQGHTRNVDEVRQPFTLKGGDQRASASTNLVGGDIKLEGGDGASASAGDAHGGDVFIAGGFGYGTGDHGNVILTATSSTGGFIGNVGIGTTTPDEKLVVTDSTTPVFLIENLDDTISDGERLAEIQFYNNDLSSDASGVSSAIYAYGTGGFGRSYNTAFDVKSNNSLITALTLRHNGNIGIGISDPEESLHVFDSGTGKIKIENQLPSLFFVDANNGNKAWEIIGHGAEGQLRFVSENDDASNQNERLVIEHNTGNVGIGTTSPYAKLSVVGETVSEFFTATSTTATSTFSGGILTGSGQFSSDVADSANAIAYNFNTENDLSTSGAKLLSIKNQGTEKVSVNKDGRLTLDSSVGDDVPIADFKENGSSILQIQNIGGGLNARLRTSTDQIAFSDSDGFEDLIFEYKSSGIVFKEGRNLRGVDFTIGPVGNGNVDETIANLKLISATPNDNSTSNITGGDIFITSGDGAANSAGDAHGGDVFIAGGFGYGTGDHGNVILTATSSTGGFIGNVGVGTVSPTSKLVVSGGALQVQDAGTTGNYPTAGQGFEITFDNDARAGATNGGSGSSIFQSFSRDASTWRDVWFRGREIQFDTNGSSVPSLYLDTSGNVGIGTSSPYAKLSVVGETVSEFFTATSTMATSTFSGGLSAGGGAFTHYENGLTSIEQLELGPTSFGDDPGTVSWIDAGITDSSPQGTVHSYSAQLDATPIATVYGEADGSGGVQNLRFGIGTTSPWRTFSVNGTAVFTSLTNDGSGYYACVNSTTGELATSTTACGASSERFKTNITDLEYGLSTVEKLRPVSFDWKESFIASGTPQIGLIAEEVATTVPEVIGYDSEGRITNLDYPKLVAITINAIQELADTLTALKEKVTGFAERFTTRELCVADEDGETTCLTKSELDNLLQGGGASGTGSPSSSEGGSVSSGEASDTEPPTITINGKNPAHIDVGASYSDLGALVTDNEDDNLGIKASVNGTDVGDPSNISIDTSTSSEHTIEYRATDNAGNTGTVTRTVVVGGGDLVRTDESEDSTSNGTSTSTPETTDETAPEITLEGSTNIELTIGDTYEELGYSATDDTDGDITENVTIGGDIVDTSTAGEYTVIYNVEDAAGNAAEEKARTIAVSEAPEEENTATSTATSTPSE